MISTDYYLLGTAILLFVAAVWTPSRPLETKAEKFRRLEEICIHDREGRHAFTLSLSKSGEDQPIP